jgi:hypothetical protein
MNKDVLELDSIYQGELFSNVIDAAGRGINAAVFASSKADVKSQFEIG